MSASEFAVWIALYNLEAHEREVAQKDAEAHARALQMARRLR